MHRRQRARQCLAPGVRRAGVYQSTTNIRSAMNESETPRLHRMASEVGEDAPLLSAKVFFSGLSFTLFGLGGLVLSLTVFPLLYVSPIDVHRRQVISRRLLSRLFRVYIRIMELFRLIKVSASDLRADGQFIVANHPSLLDVVYLISKVDNANCLVKRGMWYNPFTAGTVRATGFIRNDSPTLLEDCAASLQAGDSLIIFPEGTRTDPSKPFKFLRGAANIALLSSSDITPVTIKCRPARLMKHQKWYQMSRETLQIQITSAAALPLEQYRQSGLPRSRVARRITEDLEAFYRQQ